MTAAVDRRTTTQTRGSRTDFLSTRDVDASAGDRADALAEEAHVRGDRQRAHEDRRHAADDRIRAAEAADRAEVEAASLLDEMASRAIIGVAQGLLMARLGIGAEEAFARLVRCCSTDRDDQEVPLIHHEEAASCPAAPSALPRLS